jgi:Zn finger protein HypA/HybF involved in hydrogenase expression
MLISMARIHEIKEIKLKLIMECDCGNKYKWSEGGNTKCPKCETVHEIVMAPKSIRSGPG